MSEEVRRSSRSNKGRNRRLEEEAEWEQANLIKPRSRVTKKKSEIKTDQDDGSINCICGRTDEEEDKFMAECEKCLKWQHVECLLGRNDETIVPDGYLCHECDPKGVSRSHNMEHNDDTTVATRQLLDEDKGLKMSQEESKSTEQNGLDDKEVKDRGQTDDTTMKKRIQQDQEPASVPKKKRHTQSPDRENSADKSNLQQKTKAYVAPTDKVRASVVNALNGIFTKILIPEAIQRGDLVLPETVSLSQYSEDLSNSIESALYVHLANKTSSSGSKSKHVDVGAKYRDKFRALSFNLKDEKNSDLRMRVVCGKIAPDAVVLMSTEELRNPELRKLAESVRKESIRDSVLVVDEAPRIRKTHKGEEVVGDDDYNDLLSKDDKDLNSEFKNGSINGTDTDSGYSAGMFQHNKRDSQDADVTFYDGDDNVDDNNNNDSSKDSALTQPLLSSKSKRPSASDFFGSSQNVASSAVEYDQYANNIDVISYSPGGSSYSDEIYNNGQEDDDSNSLRLQDDKDLDDIIADRDPVSLNGTHESDQVGDFDSAATSAATTNITPEVTLWTGHVSMVGVAQFPGNAKHLSGGNIGKGFDPNKSWGEVIDLTAPIVIDGRLDSVKAAKYLKDVQATKDLVSFILDSDELGSGKGKPQFDKLYDYFAQRDKYGVIKHRKKIVKDAYVVTVKAGKIPDHLGLSIKQKDYLKMKLTETGRAIIGVFVVSPFKGSPSVPPPQSTSSAISGSTSHKQHGAAAENSLDVLANLGLSNKDFEVLKSVLSAHPEVASNPSLPDNPQLLLSILQQAAQGNRGPPI